MILYRRGRKQSQIFRAYGVVPLRLLGGFLGSNAPFQYSAIATQATSHRSQEVTGMWKCSAGKSPVLEGTCCSWHRPHRLLVDTAEFIINYSLTIW